MLFDDFKVKNVALEIEVKELRCELEKSKAQLQQFSSHSKKLDHMLSLEATSRNRKGLGYNKSSVTSTSKIVVFPISLPIKLAEVENSLKKVNKVK